MSYNREDKGKIIMADKIKWPVVNTIPATISSTSWSVLEAPIPSTLWIRPGGGNTISAQYSVDNGVTYTAITNLTNVSVYSEVRVYSGFTNIKLTTSTNAGGTWGIV